MLIENVWTMFGLNFASDDPQLSRANFIEWVATDSTVRQLFSITLRAFHLEERLQEVEYLCQEQVMLFSEECLKTAQQRAKSLTKESVYWLLGRLYPQYTSRLMELVDKMAGATPTAKVTLEVFQHVLLQWNVFFTHLKHLLCRNCTKNAGIGDFNLALPGTELRNLLMLKYGSEYNMKSNKDDIWVQKYMKERESDLDFSIDLKSWITPVAPQKGKK